MNDTPLSDWPRDDQEDVIETFLAAIRDGRRPDIEAFLRDFPSCDSSTRDALKAIEALEIGLVPNSTSTLNAVLALDGFQGTDRFRVISRLGAGGMGAVYGVQDILTGAEVALKLLPKATPAALSRFKSEFRSLAELNDPRFVKLHELYGADDRWYFTMECIEGISLSTWLQQNRGRNDEKYFEEVRVLFLDIASAVAALHRHRRIHRDLKFSNVMLRDGQKVVLIDFGLSLSLHESTSRQESDSYTPDSETSFMGSGSLPFMAPEQIAGKSLSEASDWYAVGVMLYEFIFGIPRFSGSPQEIVWAKENCVEDTRSFKAPIPEPIFQLVHRLLRFDPNERPTADEVIRCLSDHGAVAINPAEIFSTPLIGRQEEMEVLTEALSRIRSSRNHLILSIEGEGGIGKTKMLHAFLESIDRNEFFVVSGRCRQQEAIPYKAIDGLIDDLAKLIQNLSHPQMNDLLPDLSTLTIVFPSLKTSIAQCGSSSITLGEEPWKLRRHAVSAFRVVIRQLARWKPLVIAIDDLHWGDSDSAEFVSGLCESPIDGPVLFIGTNRKGHGGSPCVRALSLDLANTKLIQLGPLASKDTEVLAKFFLGTSETNGNLLKNVTQQCGGNPLFILQHISQVQSMLEGERSSLTLEETIWERFRLLDDGAREILQYICAAGTQLDIRDLVESRGMDLSIKAHIAVLRSQYFILTNDSSSDESSIEPFHDKIVEVIWPRVEENFKRRVSRKLAGVLDEKQDQRFDLIARLFEEADDPSRARQFFLRAGRQSRDAYAFNQAAKHFERAHQLGELNAENTSHSICELADALAEAGESARSAEMYLLASRLCDSERSFEYKKNAAIQLSICGKIDQSRKLFREILRRYHVSLPSALPLISVAQLLWQRLQLFRRGLDFDRRHTSHQVQQLSEIESIWSAAKGLSTTNMLMSASLQSLALRKSLDFGDPTLIAKCLAWEAVAQGTSGGKKLQKGRSILERAEALVVDYPNKLNEGMIELSRAALYLHEFQLEEAILHFDSAENHFLAYRRGAWWELGTVRWLRTTSRWHAGHLKEMMSDTVVHSEEARRRDDGYTLSNMLAVMQPYIYLMQDRSFDAIRVREEAAKVWNHKGFHFQHLGLLWSELQWLLYNRRPIDAHQKFECAWRSIKRSLILSNQLVRSMYYDFRGTCAIAAASQDSGNYDALKLAGKLASKIVKDKHVASIAFQQRLLGGIAQLQCNKAEAVTHFRQAAERFHIAKMRVHAASVEIALGGLIGGAKGMQLQQSAIDFMASEGVVSPLRFASIHTWNNLY